MHPRMPTRAAQPMPAQRAVARTAQHPPTCVGTLHELMQMEAHPASSRYRHLQGPMQGPCRSAGAAPAAAASGRGKPRQMPPPPGTGTYRGSMGGLCARQHLFASPTGSRWRHHCSVRHTLAMVCVAQIATPCGRAAADRRSAAQARRLQLEVPPVLTTRQPLRTQSFSHSQPIQLQSPAARSPLDEHAVRLAHLAAVDLHVVYLETGQHGKHALMAVGSSTARGTIGLENPPQTTIAGPERVPFLHPPRTRPSTIDMSARWPMHSAAWQSRGA